MTDVANLLDKIGEDCGLVSEREYAADGSGIIMTFSYNGCDVARLKIEKSRAVPIIYWTAPVRSDGIQQNFSDNFAYIVNSPDSSTPYHKAYTVETSFEVMVDRLKTGLLCIRNRVAFE